MKRRLKKWREEIRIIKRLNISQDDKGYCVSKDGIRIVMYKPDDGIYDSDVVDIMAKAINEISSLRGLNEI